MYYDRRTCCCGSLFFIYEYYTHSTQVRQFFFVEAMLSLSIPIRHPCPVNALYCCLCVDLAVIVVDVDERVAIVAHAELFHARRRYPAAAAVRGRISRHPSCVHRRLHQ